MTTETIEIVEKTPAPEALKQPTREELKAKGWSDAEIESGEKKGMVAKTQTPEEKAAADKAAADKKAADDIAAGKKKPATRLTGVPDFVLSPEKEKQFFELFGPNTPQRAMYVGMKTERKARQQAQAEAQKLRDDVAKLQDQITKLQTTATDEPARDEFGNVVDPDELPLTPKRLREMEAAKKLELEKKQKELEILAGQAKAAVDEHEVAAKERYEDYDDVCKLAGDLLQRLDELMPDPKDQAKVLEIVRNMRVAVTTAHTLAPEARTSADLSYELGQLHPDYGKAVEKELPVKTGEDNPNGNGHRSPEELARIKKNSERRPSSAAAGGSGRRVVSVDAMTLADLHALSDTQRRTFREKHPEKYDQLMRG